MSVIFFVSNNAGKGTRTRTNAEVAEDD